MGDRELIVVWSVAAILSVLGMWLLSSGIWKALFSLSLFMLGFSFSSAWTPWRQIVLFEGGVVLILLVKALRTAVKKRGKRKTGGEFYNNP